jgi:hypothetical protein
MSKSRIAPVRPSIAKILKRQIGGFVREYEREVNRPASSPTGPAKQPPAPAQPVQRQETPPPPDRPE